MHQVFAPDRAKRTAIHSSLKCDYPINLDSQTGHWFGSVKNMAQRIVMHLKVITIVHPCYGNCLPYVILDTPSHHKHSADWLAAMYSPTQILLQTLHVRFRGLTFINEAQTRFKHFIVLWWTERDLERREKWWRKEKFRRQQNPPLSPFLLFQKTNNMTFG